MVGEADGRFDPGDFIEFFGQRFRGPEMEQKYTDERVYWLDMGDAAGPRILDTAATPQGNPPPPADFATTLHAEQAQFWYTLHSLTMDTQDTWYWESMRAGVVGQGVTRPLPYVVPDPAAGFSATLRLELMDRPPQPGMWLPHRVTAGINGHGLADVNWTGHVREVITTTIAPGILVSGVNTVTVTAFRVPENSNEEWIYANSWELDYRRAFRAWEGRLDFRAEGAGVQEYLVEGWAGPTVEIWDISDAAQPRRLVGASAEQSGAETQVRFRASGGVGARYWLQAETTIAEPASVRLRPPTGLRQPSAGADAVIVTPASLRPAAERLAAWHRSHGRRALVADIQDIYDEFNDGILHPKAVPALLAWAATEHSAWPGPPPAYLTLVGDGHWNFKGYNPTVYPADPNLIPPYLAWADPEQGEVPADTLYADINGDTLPDLAVGRLAVNSLAEAEIVVDKIVAYDQGFREQTWQRAALFVADDADGAGDFPAVSDVIIRTRLPADLTPQRIYLGVNYQDAFAARTAISAALDAGVGLLQYTGHGGVNFWARYGPDTIWRAQDIAGLRNTRLPIVMTFNCLDGYFAYPGNPSLAELMQRQSGGGSVAAISPSGLGYTDDQHVFRDILMQVIFEEDVRELGRALTITKQRYQETYARGNRYLAYLIATMMLYGDPALRIPAELNRQFLPLTLKTR